MDHHKSHTFLHTSHAVPHTLHSRIDCHLDLWGWETPTSTLRLLKEVPWVLHVENFDSPLPNGWWSQLLTFSFSLSLCSSKNAGWKEDIIFYHKLHPSLCEAMPASKIQCDLQKQKHKHFLRFVITVDEFFIALAATPSFLLGPAIYSQFFYKLVMILCWQHIIIKRSL